MKPTNLAFLRIAKRAERQEDDILQKTFVDFGSVLTVISSIDHQVIFGRRGTGKTHLLTVLKQSKRSLGEIAIQIDMRSLGSVGGIYADPTIPLTHRATRLLIDVLAVIHSRLFEQAIEHDSLINLGIAGRALDEFFEAHTTVKVVGQTTIEASATADNANSSEVKTGLSVNATGAPQFNAEIKVGSTERETVAAKKIVSGQEIARVNFGNVATALRKIVDALPKNRLWILIDEWSEVPLDLQPYLADLLKRAVLPSQGITVKIAAIEQRSRLLIPDTTIGNVGLELGADVSTAINLDEYMVFDNDEAKAVSFFKALVLKHVQAALESEKLVPPQNQNELLTQGFTQANAFDEIVRACEGVPRDALSILSHAAQRANEELISVTDVRIAAQQWYQASKDAAVSADSQAKALLLWIVDKVIKERQTKAFLLASGTRDPLIDFLYDGRVLHVLRKSISAQDTPGVRYHVYGIDYGCYVDLINTKNAPQGLLDLGSATSDFSVAVPRTDFRSIRRCILNLADFYDESSQPKKAVQLDLLPRN